MVELMLDGFGGDWRKRFGQKKTGPRAGDQFGIQCFHVNARLSDDLEDVGGIRPGKLLRLAKYCLEAIWCRFRYGVDTLYYVPAPAKRSAILRDWVVMLCVRPWFRRTILHWHAFGLGEWVTNNPGKRTISQKLTLRLFKNADRAIVLTQFNKADAEIFSPKRISVVPNGIPDPCPTFDRDILPKRQDRLQKRRDGKADLKVLFLAHCTREKGLFDALEAIRLANLQLKQRGEPKMLLTVAGGFMESDEREEFEKHVSQIHRELGFDVVNYVGFLSGGQKAGALKDNDVLCFPTFYSGEALPVNLVEALAYGLPVITTKWRGIPEVVPEGWAFFTKPGNCQMIARSLCEIGDYKEFQFLRQCFLRKYNLQPHLESLGMSLNPDKNTSGRD